MRALALGLARQKPPGWQIQFVAATREQPYHCVAWPDSDTNSEKLQLIQFRPGDVFVGLDYSLNALRWHRRQIASFRRQGGIIWFLVHDLLPAQRPDWFSSNTVLRHQIWLDTVAAIADGFLCNSRQTEADIIEALKVYGLASGDFRTCVLPMGHDIREAPHMALVENDSGCEGIHALRGKSFFLKVGTLEPRKGHIDLIRAFETLWANGFDQTLVLLGRRGWHVDDLCEAITTHPEYGRRLIWLDNVNDAGLIEAFRESEGVLVASLAEGFGLPLIEALGHGKPVLARDIPVFKLHEPNGVWFFPADASSQTLADYIFRWRLAIRAGAVIIHPPKGGWEASVQTLLAAVTA
ncbi:glycosyltransferase [Sphingomonas paeninsulae]|uniref:glycosyltransferase n=1 Tax=Sphingomonas paeninsulae TaxID=2319844 RepID=UPI0013CE8738|nr:glycosyltransferase [Sphingomonas paeninsulae]